ncbi:scarecrow-like protein 15 [Vigna radiata var. radiata]|uniref:Scarecrow-like protein 15 n=1 Tax=Vigna radiata var. radiata TaxID=3916 RepID=A0A1S3UJS1_VIGRR|nr:scarecrow-like protein 15 [Vigna radiata var. radiata]
MKDLGLHDDFGAPFFKAFSGISLIPMFSIFTTNQVVLDHVACSFMHVIDFDIGLEIQYASLMKEIAEKAMKLPLLRITIVIPEEYAVESTLVRENLEQFALELRIHVQVNFVPLRTFETLSFKVVKLVDGESTTVLLSLVIFHHLGNAATFLADLQMVSPSVVVLVDSKGWADMATIAASSFQRGVASNLEYYLMMLSRWMCRRLGRIEMMHLRPKVGLKMEDGRKRRGKEREKS